MPDGLRLMAAWGFEYVSGFPWVKTLGLDVYRGIGFWTMATSEYVIIGKRGEPRRERGDPVMGLLTGDDRVFYAPVGAHSKKPEAVQDWVERLFPGGRFLELFARRRRAGWDCFGLDVGFELSSEGVKPVPEKVRPLQATIFDSQESVL